MAQKDWYAHWFDTAYYHMLYWHRDEDEAREFLMRLQQKFGLQNIRVLDAGCGRGRHAAILHDLGFDTTGIDLSEGNIQYAQQLPGDRLRFIHGDIRTDLPAHSFDWVVNLFTSFGYFDDEEENFRMLEAMCKALVEGGCLLLDFLNVNQVKQSLANGIWREEVVNGIVFKTRKRQDQRFVYKDIEVHDKGDVFAYQERVRLYTLDDFEQMIERIGAKVESIYGDYTFAPFNPEVSDRLILCIRT